MILNNIQNTRRMDDKMKTLERLLALALCLALTFALASDALATVVEVPVTEVRLVVSSTTLRVGGTEQITYSLNPINATNRSVRFESLAPTVASVTSTGLVTAIGPGTAQIAVIAVSNETVRSYFTVSVVQPVSVTLSPGAATLKVGDTTTLTASISPSEAAVYGVTYTSSNSSVAVVANNGTVTGVGQGTAVIMARSNYDSSVVNSCTVTVGTPVTGISISQTASTLSTGSTLVLSAYVLPANATGQGIRWSSTNTEVATVNDSGVVSTWRSGYAQIRAAAIDGSGYVATCDLTVVGVDVTPIPTATPTPTPRPTLVPGTTATPAPTAAPPAGQTAYVNTVQGSLNLRATASQNADILTRIPQNAAFTVVTYGSRWCYAWYAGLYGYVMTEFVRFGGSNTYYPGTVITLAPTIITPQPTVDPTAPQGTVAFVNTVKGSLNLRATASQNANILRRIPEKASFTVITYGSAWCYAWYNGAYGYVMTKFVSLAGTTQMPTSATVTAAPTLAPISGNQARVTTPHGDLNLRQSPNVNSSRIRLIPQNAVVTVVTYGKEWCYVKYNSYTGYVMTKFLTLASGSGSLIYTVTLAPTYTPAPTVPVSNYTTQYAQVSTAKGGLNLRNGAGTGYARTLIIPQNAYVQVITRGADWCYVKYNNYTGYVMTKFLKMI